MSKNEKINQPIPVQEIRAEQLDNVSGGFSVFVGEGISVMCHRCKKQTFTENWINGEPVCKDCFLAECAKRNQ